MVDREPRQIFEEQVDKVLAPLDPREKVVIRLHFGFVEDGRSRTLAEIGQDPRIRRSKSTVWRIEQEALEKLRVPGPKKGLRDYLE